MYKNNQLWNRYFPRSQRISYRYRETPWCPSIYFIDLNQFLLLFLLTITKQKYFSSSPKLFFLLHCLWIYPAPYDSTSILRELYCYDLLHLRVSKQWLALIPKIHEPFGRAHPWKLACKGMVPKSLHTRG